MSCVSVEPRRESIGHRTHSTRPVALRQSGAVTAQRVLVIDSYDSFVYNLVQYLGELGADPIVVRNDQITVDEALALEPDAVLLSPGPGRPEDAGIICPVVPAFAERGVRVLGVCLGLSGDRSRLRRLDRARAVVDARQDLADRTSRRRHLPRPAVSADGDPLSQPGDRPGDDAGLPRGHGRPSGDVVMGVRHRTLPIEGVQFHPESILTGVGHDLLRNFLDAAALTLERCDAANVRALNSTASGVGVGRRVVARRRVSDAVGHCNGGRVRQSFRRSRSRLP